VIGADGKDEREVLRLAAIAEKYSEQPIARSVMALKELGSRIIMLTGDNPRVAQAVAREIGVDEFRAGVVDFVQMSRKVLRRIKLNLFFSNQKGV